MWTVKQISHTDTMAVVESRKFCCCLPVRLGVFVGFFFDGVFASSHDVFVIDPLLGRYDRWISYWCCRLGLDLSTP